MHKDDAALPQAFSNKSFQELFAETYDHRISQAEWVRDMDYKKQGDAAQIVCEKLNEQQIRLDTAVHGINSNGIERQRESNKGYLQELKAFLTDLNTLNRKNSHSDFIWKLR